MKSPIISVVIPVYNAETTIKRLLNSLLNQTSKNFEIIIVDDGSNDKTSTILKRYTKEEKIILVNQSNAGTASARNYGIKIAKGKYILFVDADDYLEPVALETYGNIISEHNPDLVISGFIEETENEILNQRMPFEKKYSKQKEFANDLLYLYKQGLIYNVWNKLYKKDFIISNNLEFPQVYFYEDHLFNILAFKKASIIYTTNKCIYHYVRNQKNSITSNYIPNLFEIRVNENKEMVKMFKTFNIDKQMAKKFIAKRFLDRTIGCLENIQLNKTFTFKEKYKLTKEIITNKETQKYINIYEHQSFITKLLFFLYKRKFTPLVYLLGFILKIIRILFPTIYVKLKNRR